MTPAEPGLRRPNMRRIVVVMPSAFTLGNLFFGFWAIISAANGNFRWAAWFVLFAGILDMLDGRVARLSKTSGRFGAELDSLVDVISFGVAPAMILYYLEFQQTGKFAWLICIGYVMCTALRLARYNVTADTKPAGAWFTGIPSPAAGMTLAVYYPFSQTEWYQASLAYLNLQHQGLVVLTIVMAILMVSNVRYPKFPGIGFRSARGLLGLAFHLLVLIAGLTVPEYFFFPLGMLYMVYGVARAMVLGLLDLGETARHADDGTPQPLNEANDAAELALVRETRTPLRGDRRQENTE